MGRLAYSRSEVADMLGVSIRTIDRRIRSGRFRVLDLGRPVRILAADVHSLVGRHAADRTDSAADRWAREVLRRVR
jgi:excisionase family DNA binding protein